MKSRVSVAVVAGTVLVLLSSVQTTRALWRDQAALDPGTVPTGSLVLLVGGDSEVFVFDGLSAGKLAPGHSVRAPLTISNGGSTDMAYSLASVATAAAGAADQELSAALLLSVTVADACGGTPPPPDMRLLDAVPLNSAPAFAGRLLAPSASETLCIEIALDPEAPAAAASGTTSASFIFKGDQRL